MKFTGIKKAVGEFNNWDNGARIYLDTEKLEVWCDTFVDGNSWTNYKDSNIREVMSKGYTMASKTDKTTVAGLQAECEKAVEEIKTQKKYEKYLMRCHTENQIDRLLF